MLPQQPPARPLPNPAFVTDHAVNALARSGDTIYLGGDFTRIGPPTGGGGVLDPASGLRAAQFPEVRGIGFATVADGAGGYYIGGRFTNVGGLPRKNLAHVLASGAVDQNFAPYVDDDVLALALDGGRLYIGGDFLHVGDVIRRRLAALDPVSGVVVGAFNPGADQSVQDLAMSGTRMFVNGRFIGIAGHSRSGIAVLDTHDGSWIRRSTPFPTGRSTPCSLGSRFYVGGTFTEVSGRSRAGLAAFDVATGDPDSDVYALTVTGGRLVAGGKFTSAPRTQANHLVAVNAVSGATMPAWGAGTDGSVRSLAVADGRVFAGGAFTTANGAKRRGLAGFDVATGALSVLDVPVRGVLETLAADGRRLYLGGSFERVGGKRHPALAAVNLAANEVGPTFNAPRTLRRASFRSARVHAIAPHGSRVLVGGDVNVSRTVGPKGKRRTQFRSGVVAVRRTDAQIDYGFESHVSGTVQALELSGNTIYVGGSFPRRSGTKIVKLKPRKGKKRSRTIAVYRYNLVAEDAATGALRRQFQPSPNGKSAPSRSPLAAVRWRRLPARQPAPARRLRGGGPGERQAVERLLA